MRYQESVNFIEKLTKGQMLYLSGNEKSPMGAHFVIFFGSITFPIVQVFIIRESRYIDISIGDFAQVLMNHDNVEVV